jgi:hypothetical protein
LRNLAQGDKKMNLSANTIKKSVVSRMAQRGAFLLMVLLCISTLAFAQSTTDGAIGGTVTDSSNAAVPGASVTATNLGTSLISSDKTDINGRYQIIHLQPGSYSLEISAKGLATFKQTAIIVEVGRVTTIDATLGVAGQTTTVEVKGEAPVMVTDRPDFSTNINQTTIENLPVYVRRWSWFTLSTPGVVPDGGFGLVSFRGISGLLNNNTVDGADNNQAFFSEERGRTRMSYSTSEASIQEFQVNTSNYSAEYGRAAGGVVNAVTKSGTNSIHGEAFWFLRSSDWGAINPFSFFKGKPFLPEDKRHQFGGAIGGPVIKNKLFWFFSADQQLRPFPAAANSGIPNAIFAPISVVPPSTCPAHPGSTEPSSTFTEGNILFCRGITQAQTNTAVGLLTNLTGTVKRRGDQLILLPKIDWVVNSKNHASVSYNRVRWNSPEGIQTGATVTRGIESFGNDYVKDDWVVARLTTNVSSSWINELRYQYGRDFEFENGQSSIAGEPISQLGVSPQVSVGGVGTFVFGMPNFLNRPAYPDERRNQVADTLAWSHNTHLVKFGFDINHVNDKDINLFEGFGAYSYASRVDYISDFVSATTMHAPFCGSSGGVQCYANFAQGFGTPGFNFSTNDVALFVQDDWRIRPRLTINLGLRWEREILPAPQVPNATLPLTNTLAADNTDFGPRIGFAWDLTGSGKTILRGGYGIYFGRIINSTIFQAIAVTGSTLGQNTVFVLPSSSTPTYPNVFPSGSAPPGLTPVQFAPGTRTPMVHEFDLEGERQIGTNTVISISYLGSLGRRLPRFVDTNLNPPTLTNTFTIVQPAGTVSSPFVHQALIGQMVTVPSFAVPTFSSPSTGRPNSTLGSTTNISDSVTSNYNALVLGFNRRMYQHFQVQAGYTWSRANDFGQLSQTFSATNSVLNPFNLGADYGPSTFDIRQRFNAGVVWSADYYHGDSSLLKTLLNGFVISPIFYVATGAPFTPFVSGNAPVPAGFKAVSGGSGILLDNGTSQLFGTRVPFFSPNSFRMPRTADVDLRIQKAFAIWESWKLTLIGDAFNLFNHTNFTAVDSQMYTISGSTLIFNNHFGVPTASSNTLTAQRQIQVGIKLDW